MTRPAGYVLAPPLTYDQAAYFLWSSGGFGAFGVKGDAKKVKNPPAWAIEELAISVAIGVAESGLIPNNENLNGDGSWDYGFMQINLPTWSSLGYTREQLFDPVTCANAAGQVATNKSTRPVSFLPWNTYKHGKHFPYMPKARIAAKKVLKGNVTSGGAHEPPLQGGFTHPGEFATGTVDFLSGLLPWDQLFRLLYIIGGAVLAFMALRMLANEFGAGIPRPSLKGGFS